jgi:hypothetical protein
MASIDTWKAELVKVQSAIARITDTGTNIQIPGAMSVTTADLPTLYKRESQLRRDILRYSGYTNRTQPDFSDDGGGE